MNACSLSALLLACTCAAIWKIHCTDFAKFIRACRPLASLLLATGRASGLSQAVRTKPLTGKPEVFTPVLEERSQNSADVAQCCHAVTFSLVAVYDTC